MKRRTVACLYADVHGYGRLIGLDVESTVKPLTAYRALMTCLGIRHAGRVVDSAGDTFLAEFTTVSGAVRCAVDLQDELSRYNTRLPRNRRVEFRVGIDLGRRPRPRGPDPRQLCQHRGAGPSHRSAGRRVHHRRRLRPDGRHPAGATRIPGRACAQEHRCAGASLPVRMRMTLRPALLTPWWGPPTIPAPSSLARHASRAPVRQAAGGEMGKRILVTGGGTGASNNLIGSLRTGDPTLFIASSNDDRFILKKSSADRKYLVPVPSSAAYLPALRRLIKSECIDLVIPTGDADVRALSDLRDRLRGRLFLPARAVIDRCQDKYALIEFLRSRGLPAPETHAVTGLDAVETIFARMGPRSPLWCRTRTGSRSLGAAPVATAEQARGWMLYWEEMRGVRVTDFTISEYLPGRDFLCQSLWQKGRLILVNTFERLSYFGGENSPSGVSSLSSLAKTVVDQRIVDVCRASVQALDGLASGAFSIDLKEDSSGVPCITEINAGRFLIGMTALDHVGKQNMPLTYVRLGLGESVDMRDEYDSVEDYYLVRDLDTAPGVFHADSFFDGIEEA